MNIKTLLLGTAAAFSVVGGAQAADLAVAEPVDYVKVCDVYGAGYWYIPGTDTCIRIGGYVKETVTFHDDAVVYDAPPLGAGGVVSNWKMSTEAGVNVTAQTMTDWGKAQAYIAWVLPGDDRYTSVGGGAPAAYGVDTSRLVNLDAAWGSIGGFGWGWKQSNFDVGGGFTDAGVYRSDVKTDQFWFSTSLGAWGLLLAIESPYTARWGETATGDFPDLILGISGAAGMLAWSGQVGVTDRVGGTGWGLDGAVTADLGGGTKLKVGAAYSSNAPSFAGATNGAGAEGTAWSAFVSGVIALSSTVGLAASYSYLDDVGPGNTKNKVSVDLTFALSKTTSAFIEGNWLDNGAAPDTWSAIGVVKQSFGG